MVLLRYPHEADAHFAFRIPALVPVKISLGRWPLRKAFNPGWTHNRQFDTVLVCADMDTCTVPMLVLSGTSRSGCTNVLIASFPEFRYYEITSVPCTCR